MAGCCQGWQGTLEEGLGSGRGLVPLSWAELPGPDAVVEDGGTDDNAALIPACSRAGVVGDEPDLLYPSQLWGVCSIPRRCWRDRRAAPCVFGFLFLWDSIALGRGVSLLDRAEKRMEGGAEAVGVGEPDSIPPRTGCASWSRRENAALQPRSSCAETFSSAFPKEGLGEPRGRPAQRRAPVSESVPQRGMLLPRTGGRMRQQHPRVP